MVNNIFDFFVVVVVLMDICGTRKTTVFKSFYNVKTFSSQPSRWTLAQELYPCIS